MSEYAQLALFHNLSRCCSDVTKSWRDQVSPVSVVCLKARIIYESQKKQVSQILLGTGV